MRRGLKQQLIDAVRLGDLSEVKRLVARGADISAKQDLIFRIACQRGHLDVVKYLAEHGVDMQTYGSSAVGYASEEGHLEVVQFLVAKGADMHVGSNLALVAAFEYGHTEVFEFLLQAGDWQSKDEEGLTELDKLERDGDVDIIVAHVKKHVQDKKERARMMIEQKQHAKALAVLKASPRFKIGKGVKK